MAEQPAAPAPRPWDGNVQLIGELNNILEDLFARRRLPNDLPPELVQLAVHYGLEEWLFPRFGNIMDLFNLLREQGLDHHLDDENFRFEDIIRDQRRMRNEAVDLDWLLEEAIEGMFEEMFEWEDELDEQDALDALDQDFVEDDEIPQEPF